MAGPRSTWIYDTVLDSQSNPVQLGAVSVSLLPTTVGIQYNVADSYQYDTVTPSVLQTLTANTAPSSAPTVANVAGATSMTAGAHKYFVAFQGTTSAGVVWESAASVASNQVTNTSGDTNNLTAIPAGPTGTTARILYRTLAAGSTGYYLTTISDNTTTTYADTAADSSLNQNRSALALGGWQMPVIALGDLTPTAGALSYQVSENGVVNSINTFAYSATAVHASTLYAGAGASTPTSAFTGNVLDPGGNPKVGVTVTAQLSATGTSTVTSATISASSIISATTNSSGAYTLNLVPTDHMTPSGLYYKVTEGPGGVTKTINAPNGGGTVNGNLTTPLASGSVTSFQGTHFSGGAANTHAVNANAGTGAAKDASAGGNDFVGVAAWTSGTAAWATGVQYTVTWKLAWGTAPQVILVPINTHAASAISNGVATVTVSTSSFTISFGTADTASTDYQFYYIVGGLNAI